MARKNIFIVLLLVLLAACATTTGPGVDKNKMAEGYYMKGYSYFQEKKYELASVEFNRSIQTSDYKQSYYMLGILSDYRGQYEDATGYYKKAIAIDPDYSEAYNAMGADYFYEKKWKEAIRSFKKALENKLYPTPHLPYINIGRVYMAQKDYTKAIEAYRQAKSFANLDLVNYELGNALLESGKIKEAISAFREGVGMAPRNAELRYGLALALLKEGNTKGALAEFQKAADLAPGSKISLQAKDYIKTLR